MKKIILIVIVVVFTLTCKKNNAQDIPVEKRFQKILDDAIDEKNITGVSVTIIAPDLDINWSGAAGFDSATKDNVLKSEQPFRIASVTKSFVATAILKLHEQNKLDIDDSINKYISKEHDSILKLDTYNTDEITIRQCLYHRSGLFDYAMGNDSYIATALKDPYKRWTRTEQILFAIENGEPLGKPGKVFGYSDTGYILLGETLENITGKGLAESLRDILDFKKLGLNATWLESLEDKPKNVPSSVKRYMESMDASNWDNSVDLYGGGGLSSTSKDLAIFFNALFNHKIFEKKETLDLMLKKPEKIKKQPDHYRMGLWKTKAFDTYGYTHNGFWGTAWIYIPKYNTTIAINYTKSDEGAGVFRKVGAVIKSMKK